MLPKTIEEDGLEICTKGMQKHKTIDEYVHAWCNQIWKYGYLRWFKDKMPIQRLRHLRTTCI